MWRFNIWVQVQVVWAGFCPLSKVGGNISNLWGTVGLPSWLVPLTHRDFGAP